MQAGYLNGYGDNDYLEDLPLFAISRRNEQHLYKVFVIEGDSMDDRSERAICDEDKIIAKQLPLEHWQSIFTGRKFVIVSKSEGIICKEIKEVDYEAKTITCHSYNKSFKDFTLKLGDDVKELYYVKEIMRKVG